MLCKIIGRILWKDYDNDGLEIGLAKAQGSGTPISWRKDADHNGRVDLYEPESCDGNLLLKIEPGLTS
ncbi:MAG: hypothetical protein QXH13_04745 [Thermoplasmata archaeon]